MRRKRNEYLIKNTDCKDNTSQRYEYEVRDCTVRAYSEAFEIPYSVAHYKLEQYGRRQRHGIVFQDFMSKRHPDIQTYPRPHMTVGKFIYFFGMGNWIIRVKGHVFCVKDKVIFDKGASPETLVNCPVLNAWLVKPKINDEMK